MTEFQAPHFQDIARIEREARAMRARVIGEAAGDLVKWVRARLHVPHAGKHA
ncbi:RSP_7527 family protein [Mesobaculum littorinae]|uniref:RSP_7527 family protein n=1 Tax=Mesobaculum littorinae TaxID=2486419 RepID=UPI0013E3022B|nr:hypothetical protein [Mesobaculum littorinae]